MNILAIESSCDETAVAVVRDGRTVLADCIASQVALHKIYGGVVPEIASRKHIEAISALADEAIANIRLVSDETFGQILITDCNPTRLRTILDKAGGEYLLYTVENGKARR